MRKMTIVLAAALGLVLLVAAGCGGDDAADVTTEVTDTGEAAETVEEALDDVETALPDSFTLQLAEQNDSGISGEVELSPTSEGQLEVEIELDGSDGGPHPAHIHRGSCADLDPNPEFPLEDVVDGESDTTLEISPADIVADEYAINVHESPESLDVYVACADVRSQ